MCNRELLSVDINTKNSSIQFHFVIFHCYLFFKATFYKFNCLALFVLPGSSAEPILNHISR